MGMPTFVTSDMSRCDAITDIIQSVALQQAALSHILNAEGEKIQYILADKCSTTEDILEVNKSVRQTVDSVARLEILLQQKLSLFDACLCECQEKPKPHKPGFCDCKEHPDCPLQQHE